ncbi:MAG TPA: hypothetical protein VEY67_08935, partial [Candidatus Dormibacteraeota bacterium]|nr:hypothetical protein [Candidatus Dormibacteraeota bacterium]
VPSAPMDARRAARRDLTVLAVAVIAVSRAADGPVLWAIGALLFAAVVVGWLQVVSEGEPRGVPLESLLLPGSVVLAGLGGVRLVPLGPALIPAVAVVGVLLDRCMALEARLVRATSGPTEDDRTELLVLAMVTAFVGFAGAASILPGGLAEPVGEASPLDPARLAALAAADAGLAGLLAYRIVALGRPSLRSALIAAVTSAILIAVTAGALRALAVPRLIGPAALTVVLFLWTSIQAARSARRDARWVWELVLLGVLGVLVVAMNLRLSG